MNKFVIMGVAGAGKTAIGELLAPELGADFVDGDGLHPPQNIAKMTRGEALNDADRAPWLVRVGETLQEHDGTILVACSALKRAYRDIIRTAAGESPVFLFLQGNPQVIENRMRQREGHFMPVDLLASQLATLEPPQIDEAFIKVDIDKSRANVARELLGKIERFEQPD